MVGKILIGILAIGTVAGCTDYDEPIAASDSNSISSGRLTTYLCYDVNESDRVVDGVRASFDIIARTKRKTSQTMPDFKMGWDHFKDYALYEANISYHTIKPDPDNPGPYPKQNVFKYKNVDFKYDNGDLILKIPKDDNFPACQIWFKKTSKNSEHKIGEHKCEFEKSDVGYRAATFDFACGREGKIGMFSEPKL